MNNSKPAHRPQNYRPDIDGLRAIAILSVLVFHIEETLLPGGFLGVDIFFVISGYLISLHIYKDIDRGTFSLLEFYRRRVKRIMPPMLVVVLITLLASQLLFTPEDAMNTASASLWSILSLANVYFWLFLDTGYFATASNEIPLLHLWSLGVEEQFYIFWPLILMAVFAKTPRTAFAITLILVIAASFLFAELFFNTSPSFTYYMLPSRAGELMLGSLAAFIVLRKGDWVIPQWLVFATALVSLAVIFLSLIKLSEDDVFPGLIALPATGATALLILCGHYGKNLVSSGLSIRPMVWVGLVSYSAYLWHWPLLAFYRYAKLEMTLLAGISIAIATFILAWLSYLYIETPARRSTRSAVEIILRQFVVPASCVLAVCVAALLLEGYGPRKFSSDYVTQTATLESQSNPSSDYDFVCQGDALENSDISSDRCLVGPEVTQTPSVLLVGDSNAAHLVGMLSVFANQEGFVFKNLQINACPPITGVVKPYVVAKRALPCEESLDRVWADAKSFSTIILSSSWSMYQWRDDSFLSEVERTALEFSRQGKLVILVGKVPEFVSYDRFCPQKRLSLPFLDCRLPDEHMRPEIERANTSLRSIAGRLDQVEYFDLTDYLCRDGMCSPYDQSGESYYFDASHLSYQGSVSIGERIYREQGSPFPFSLVSLPKQTSGGSL